MKRKLLKRKALDLLLKAGYKLDKFKPRPMIRFCKEYFNDEPVNGMEIGVFVGNHTKEILNTLNVKRMYLIDPYEEYIDDQYEGEYTQSELDIAKTIAHKRLKGCIWVNRESLTPELDFVYIDGNHTYEAVKQDIIYALCHLRKGGVIGGHDYTLDFPGVTKAVKQRFKKHNHLESDWWAIV